MIKININKDGYVQSPNFPDADIEIEISEETYEKIRSYPMKSNWRYINNTFVLEELMDDKTLRMRRQKECFEIIDNRSQLWYNHLTSEQKQELDVWYEEWLSVTETHVIPVKPEWLK